MRNAAKTAAAPVVVLVSVALAGATPAAAQPGTVRGQVTDAATGEAIPIARVSVEGTRIRARTNQDGRYTLSGVPLGNVVPPGNLVFLLDVSGSMESDDKLPLLKRAFALLVDQLRPRDRVAIVVYAGAAGMVLPSTPGNRRERILAALDKLRAGGGTAGGAGLELAYATAFEHFIEDGNNRIILATDGDFNVGASSDAEMVRLIEQERDGGIFLTVMGFGTGNLKDSKMEQIADHGNGNFHYVDGLLEARKVLVEEMGGTLFTLAKDVKLQVEFNPARVAGYRLIGYENRLLADEDFNDDTRTRANWGRGTR